MICKLTKTNLPPNSYYFPQKALFGEKGAKSWDQNEATVLREIHFQHGRDVNGALKSFLRPTQTLTLSMRKRSIFKEARIYRQRFTGKNLVHVILYPTCGFSKNVSSRKNPANICWS